MFAAVTLNVNFPAFVGFPEIFPEVSSVKPVGSLPVYVHVTAVSLVAVRVAEYSVPVTAMSRFSVVIAGGMSSANEDPQRYISTKNADNIRILINNTHLSVLGIYFVKIITLSALLCRKSREIFSASSIFP